MLGPLADGLQMLGRLGCCPRKDYLRYGRVLAGCGIQVRLKRYGSSQSKCLLSINLQSILSIYQSMVLKLNRFSSTELAHTNPYYQVFQFVTDIFIANRERKLISNSKIR